ncbi:Ribose transport system permease protein RbsC [Streptomyces sp. YIM 130001]|uniref:ABC transporter permease n=1 Tax=Streptomyces sp. YIM 130001 TaxID=2259644 RepID=UPI000E65175E|nr:ABC transporter permease [Streptomyces sp. YIM 130001]RII14744.1 Ribose transport system permease protein RbsC [Streptomyces sp. YIM 130001]
MTDTLLDQAKNDGPDVRTRAKRLLPWLGSLQSYIGLVLIVAIGIATQGDTFLDQTNLTNAVGNFASRGILAVGVTLVILTAGIDLSVGSLLGFASMASAMMVANHDMPVWQIVPLCMLIGAAFGFVNGVGTSVLRIQSFVMTLAMLSIARGLDRQMSDNQSVGTTVAGPDGKLTENAEAFQSLGTPGHNVGVGFLGPDGVYYPVLAFVIVCVVFHLILSRTAFGRHIYAVGGNPTAARLSGINVTLVVIAVFTLSGMLAGFAGPIDAAYSVSADPQAGNTYELDAIAAAVIGGASLAGGKGTIIGTFVGALILTLLDNVLGLNAVSDNWQLVIKGLIVVVAVVLQRPELLRTLRNRLTPARKDSAA